jgi:hypothetical protein
MYQEKTVRDSWTVPKTTVLDELTIEKGAKIEAPEGKALTFTVNGVAHMLEPGVYKGRVALAVHDFFDMLPSGLMRYGSQKFPFRVILLVEDGKVVEEKSIPEALGKNYLTGGPAIYCMDDSLNGILVTGDGKYVIDGAKLEFDGFGGNDFIGMGAGLLTFGNAEVEVNDSDIWFTSPERCAAHIGGDSTVRFTNCTVMNLSPLDARHDTGFAWQIGVRGTNRTIQLTDNGTVYYDNCLLKGSGWGTLSVDGGISCRMILKDSHIELSGAHSHGYGAYAIGHSAIEFDHCTADVNGYPIFMMTELGSLCEVKNGSVLASPEVGALIMRDDRGILRIADSKVVTGIATVAVKGSGGSVIEFERSVLEPENGVVVSLFDNEEGGGMGALNYKIPVGVKDTYTEGRDLTSEGINDIHVKVTDMAVHGDFYNSTTDLHYYREGDFMEDTKWLPTAEGIDAEANELGEALPDLSESRTLSAEMQGAHNLILTFTRAKVVGAISSASQAYAGGLTVIDQANREQLNHVIQTPAPPVNNGVVAKLDKDSIWTLTQNCWLTALTVEEGAIIKAPEGRKLTVKENGEEIKVKFGNYAGSYKGVIELIIE